MDLASRIQPSVLLARSTKGAAAAKVLVDAINAPGVYMFSELLEVPNIQALENDSTYTAQYKLLQLFAYGTLAEYEAEASTLPPLSPAQLIKLKHLTLVSEALKHRSIPYDQLLSALRLNNVRELEDLIIDVIYAGLMSGKMHHHEKILHVDWVAGRDLRDADLVTIQEGLANWCKTASTLLSALDTQIDHIHRTSSHETRRMADYNKQRDEAYYAIASDPRTARDNRKPNDGFGGPAGFGGMGMKGGGGRMLTRNGSGIEKREARAAKRVKD